MTNYSKALEKSDGYQYSPSVMSKLSFLPHSKPDSTYLKKTNGNSSITISASEGKWAYGTIPRMFLLHVRSLIKNGDACVDVEHHTVYLDKTYHSFCESIGINYTGADRERALTMVKNLATTSIVLENWSSDKFKTIHSFFVANYVGLNYGTSNKSQSYIKFSPEMWALLTENCVPLNSTIIKQLKNDALALDVYQWLAFRANSVRRETCVSWDALRAQFKYDGYPMRKFKYKFKTVLEKIQRAWPELKIKTTDAGVTVCPSIPSIYSVENNTVEDVKPVVDDYSVATHSSIASIASGNDVVEGTVETGSNTKSEPHVKASPRQDGDGRKGEGFNPF